MTADAALLDDIFVNESAAFVDRGSYSKSRAVTDVSSYSLYTFAPTWLDATRRQLAKLGELPSDWNSYGAKPISKRARSTAFELLQQLCSTRTPQPALVPTANGSVQIEWHSRGIDLEIRVLSDSAFWVSLEDAQDEVTPIDSEVGSDLRQVRRAIDVLSAR